MPTYVLMTKLDPATMKTPEGRTAAGRAWKRRVDSLCPDVRWLAHYSLLGPYDYIDIYEAPDQQTAFKVSLLSRQAGALAAESWPALEYEKHLAILEDLGSEG
jgi:uncharacterized protein with GYD domain